MENSSQLKHPHLAVAKVHRKSNSLSMVVVGSKIICLLKYSRAAIILQRSGDVAVLLNPGPINAGNLSTLSHRLNLLNLPNPTCHMLKLHLSNKGLRFGQWNVNHLTSSKFEQIKLLLTTNSDWIDILFLTETFPKPSNCDSLYNIPGFTLLRKDRLHKAGGGIAVYCSDALTFNRRVDLEYDSVEILWLEICPFKSKRSLLISGCYRPSYSRDDDKLFDQCIETAYLTNKEVILTGDFHINFLSQEFTKHYLSKSLMNMHFCQLSIYTNKCQHITAALVENYALSDHLPTFAIRKYFKLSKSTNSHDSITYRDLKILIYLHSKTR